MRPGALFCVLALGALPAAGADLWQRTRAPVRARERETLQALHRALEGTADPLDEHLVRVSIVDVAQGKAYGDPLTLVYALRMRRLLGLARLPGDAALLRAISGGEGSREAVCLAAVELARIDRLAGDGEGARIELDRILRFAWQSEILIEAYLMRGWLAVQSGDLGHARADFRALLAFDLGRPRLALALSSLAWAELLRGDVSESKRLFQRAQEVGMTSAALGSTPANRPELLPSDRAALLALEQRLSTSARDGDEHDLDP